MRNWSTNASAIGLRIIVTSQLVTEAYRTMPRRRDEEKYADLYQH